MSNILYLYKATSKKSNEAHLREVTFLTLSEKAALELHLNNLILTYGVESVHNILNKLNKKAG